ncbi:Deoxycytidine kinase 1 [Rhizina undulata]
MPWTPLPRIAFAIATHPFNPTTRDDLPLELGDELYIIESCNNGQWYRGYLVAPPSLLAGLTSTKGATLEARVFSGIFPACCVDVKEYLSTEVPLLSSDSAEGFGYEYDEDIIEYINTGNVNGRGEANGSSETNGTKSNRSSARTKKSSRTKRKRQSLAYQQNGERLRPAAPVPMLKVGDETSFESEPLVDEIASCLREWHAANLHELLLGRQYPLLDEISGIVQKLDVSRRQLLHNVLTNAELAATRESTVWALVKGNKLLSREIIVREPTSGRILTGEDSSVEITTLQSQMSLLDTPPTIPHEGITLHHLLLEHKSFVGLNAEPTSIVFYLATKNNIPLSESFEIELFSQGAPTDPSQFAKMRTLFTDLSSRDATEEIFLIARIYTTATIVVGGHTVSKSQTVPSEPIHGGTLKKTSINADTSSSKEQKLKGRVSVLFSSRPKTPGKENETESTSSAGSHTACGTGKCDDNGTPTATSPPATAPPALQPKRVSFKKPLGIAVLDIGRFIKQEHGAEHVMRIFVPSGTSNSSSISSTEKSTGSSGTDKSCIKGYGECDDWDRLIQDIIDSRTDKLCVPAPLRGGSYSNSNGTDMRLPSEKCPKADRLHVYLRPFTAPVAESLIKSTPTLLHNIVCTQKLGFSGAPTKPRSDIYITVCNPILPRHSVLLHPKTGTYPLPPPSHFNALQVSLEVRRATGERIKNCIFSSSNSDGVTVWKSTVIGREDSWNETVKLVLNEEDVPNVHVFMTVSSIPHAPVALAWFPLWHSEAFLRDGDHALAMHKHDDWTSSPTPNFAGIGGYLTQTWLSGDEGTANPMNLSGAAAALRIKSYLCSTKFSQDDVVLSLLKWKTMSQPELVTLLKKVVFVPEIEIVKLIREVFDALFEILVEYAKKGEIEDLVFIALVTVLGIVNDRRFHLEPIVNEYAEKHFDYPFSTPCLVRAFTRLLQDPTNPETSRKLRATFKVGRYIFRFIVYARGQQAAKEAVIGINVNVVFTRELQGIFKSLESLMRNNAPMLVGTQTLAVQHFHLWLPELVGTLSREEILLLAIDFTDACDGVKGKLVLYKLVLIVNYSLSTLFSAPEDRRALTLNTVRWLEPHWGKCEDVTAQWREQVRLCCSVLAAQINELGEEVSEYIPKIVESYMAIQATGRHERETFSLLFPKTYPFPTRSIPDRPVFDEALIELAAILAAMSNIPTGLHLDLPENELAKFLMDDLQVHMSILSCDAFPESWLSVHIYQHKAIMKTLETLAGILVDSFLPDPDDAEKFNMELWQAFFSTLLMLVGSDALALETFPEQKRRAVWKVAGDVREQGADLLRRTWEAIGWETSAEDRSRFGIEKMGGYQVQYVPGLVAPIVELCLSVHEGLRSVAVEVLQTMVVSEWTLSQDLSVIQAEMIDSLDRLFKSKRLLTESITQKLFIADLIDLFEPLSLIPDDPLTVVVRDLLHTVDEFLDLLVAVHSTPLGEAYQILDTLRLMDFLKDMRKEDMFIRYVHQLVTVQVEAQNYVEAGLSLQLHADLYQWEMNEKVPALADPPFPPQTAFERREALFLEMIKYFEDGKSWENALDTYKELAYQYENVLFDYSKLAKCHRAMAKIHEDILNGDRYATRYFRVAYLGMGFPIGLRDRQFIVQGYHWEEIAAFTDRIQQQHPSAKIIDSGEVDSVEGQFINIIPVEPEHDLLHPVFQRAKVPANTRQYLLEKRSKVFGFSRPLPENDSGQISSWWTEKTTFTTSESFPTILRRSEIIQVVTERVSPIENAIEAVTKKTADISALERKYSELKGSESQNVGPFSMALSTAIESPTNGGVAIYRELLDDEDLKLELRNALRTAILDHVAILKKCLSLHGRLANNQLRPIHENMTRYFERNFAEEIGALMPPPQITQGLPLQLSIPVSPGQWRGSYSPNGLITPVPLKRNTITPNTKMNGLEQNPPRSSGEDSASVVSTRGRLSSMIFFGTAGKENGVFAALSNAANGHAHHKKEGSTMSEQRSRNGSISTSNAPRSRAGSTSRSRSKSVRRRPGHGEEPPIPNSSNGYYGNGRSVVSETSSINDEFDHLGPGTRPSTSSTRPPGSSGSGIVERGVGSVKRRFSILKLGRKGSKGNVKDGTRERPFRGEAFADRNVLEE